MPDDRDSIIEDALQVFSGRQKGVRVAHKMTPLLSRIYRAVKTETRFLAVALERTELLSQDGDNPVRIILGVKTGHELDYLNDPVTRAKLEGVLYANLKDKVINIRFALAV